MSTAIAVVVLKTDDDFRLCITPSPCTSWLQSAVALNAAVTSSPPTLPLPYIARYPVLSTVTTLRKRTPSISDAARLKTCGLSVRRGHPTGSRSSPSFAILHEGNSSTLSLVLPFSVLLFGGNAMAKLR
ncbi:hypothetical protein DFP72DRAFT_1082307 [Ephemerocybe angulata]|uniref:Uncharacterized protein n=1 Tax=Ephemerocybe angulata TaxID=980116 RepID=A0A8H6HAB8_9AGAR|nr:hypothetical protein DFP72DRAFT_1082307 [Tulosesus angulatus]